MRIATHPREGKEPSPQARELEARRAGLRQAQAWPIASVVAPGGPSTPVYLGEFGEVMLHARRAGFEAAGLTGAEVVALAAPPQGTVVSFVEGTAAHHPMLSGGTGGIVAHVIGAHTGTLARRPGQGQGEGRERLADAPVVVELDPNDPLGTRANVTVRHPDLGRIDIAVAVVGRAVSLAFHATPSAAKVLELARPALRDTLASQGFELAEFQVSAGRPVQASVSAVHPHRHLDLEA